MQRSDGLHVPIVVVCISILFAGRTRKRVRLSDFEHRYTDHLRGKSHVSRAPTNCRDGGSARPSWVTNKFYDVMKLDSMVEGPWKDEVRGSKSLGIGQTLLMVLSSSKL